VITDVHNHAIPAAVIELLRSVPSYGVEVRDGRWHGGNHVDFDLAPAFVEIDAKLAELDGNGVERAVLSVAPPIFYYETEPELAQVLCETANGGMAEFHAAAPDRLWWMAHVPMQAPDIAARMLERATGERGCVGVEIGSSIAGRRLDEPEFEPFWAAAERLATPVMIHPDPTYTKIAAFDRFYFGNVIGMPLETTIAIKRLIAAGVLERHPGLKILLLHGGGYFPYQAGRLKHATTVRPELAQAPADPWSFLDQLWFDVITHDAQALAYLVSRVGIDQVVLGTDLPFDMALQDPCRMVREAVDPSLVQRITEANPARLFGLDDELATADHGPSALETGERGGAVRE
jgi:aminocarboxymuconate-semialdehyde decarboxylase